MFDEFLIFVPESRGLGRPVSVCRAPFANASIGLFCPAPLFGRKRIESGRASSRRWDEDRGLTFFLRHPVENGVHERTEPALLALSRQKRRGKRAAKQKYAIGPTEPVCDGGAGNKALIAMSLSRS